MPAPPHGEVAMSGQGDRPGEASLVDVTREIRGGPEHTVGVEAVTKDRGDALDGVAVLLGFQGKDRSVEVDCAPR